MSRSPIAAFKAITSDPIQRGMFFSTVEGAMFTVWAAALGGNYLTGMALYLGAGGFTLGLLGALPSFATMLQIVSAPFVTGVKKRRNFLAFFSGLQRFSAALAGLIALWLMPSKAALIFFVIMQMLAWAYMAPSTVVWQGYMADLVPVQIRGRYFATRNIWGAVVGMLTVMAYGAMLDRLPGEAGFRALYIAAFIAAALNFASWFAIPELPQGDRSSGKPFWESIKVPLAKPGPHQTTTYFFAAWAFAQGMAAPFYPVALVQKLGISYSTVATLATVASLTSIATARFWGRLQDRIGQAKVIARLTAILGVVPLLFLAGGVGGLPVLFLAHMLAGTGNAGLGLANQTMNMRLAPTEDRASYFAFFAAGAGITGFLTPAIVGPLTDHYLGVLFVASSVVSLLLSLVWQRRIEPLVTRHFDAEARVAPTA